MPQLKYLNCLALALLAVLTLASAPLPANALVADRAQVARHVHAHHAVAKRKRDNSSGQCRQRPSSASPTPTPTPTPTSTPSPAPTSSTPTSSSPSPSPTSNGSRKFGLVWSNGDEYLSNFANLNDVGYLYTWSPVIPDSARSYPNLKLMSMLWGPNQVSQFQSTVVAGYAQYAMGVNEPNEPSQAYMSPGDGFSLWMQYINPLHSQGYTLVSPACTDDDSGLQWYSSFMSSCQSTPGCVVDAMAFHGYTNNASQIIEYANTLHGLYNRPVMITEFADQDFSGNNAQPDASEMWNFAGQMKTFIDDTDWLIAGFPFAPQMDLTNVNYQNALIDGNGNPTSLAEYYYG